MAASAKYCFEFQDSRFGSRGSAVFFKIARTDRDFLYENDFDAILAITDIDISDNDNKTSANVSEAVEKCGVFFLVRIFPYLN